MRTKLFFVIAVALLWSAPVFSAFPMMSFETGNDLLGVCSDGREYLQGYCQAYVVGVADAMSAMDATKANGYPIPSACIPKGEHVKSEQVRDVVVQYLTAQPEIRHQAAAGHALVALQAAFSCK